MAASLVPRTGGPPIFLDKPIVLIGRQQDCDAVLQSSTKVSRRHCCIARVNEQYVIRDLGSMNGVRINGARVIESLLSAGDEVAIGDQLFVLNLGESASPRKPSNGHHARPSAPARAPQDLSLEFPVAIPESGFDDGMDGPSLPVERPVLKDPMDDIQLKEEPSDSEVGFMPRA